MRDGFLKLYDWNGRLVRWAAVLAGIAAFVIMWVVDINAFSRKLFNVPLPAGLELTESLLPVVIMLPFGWGRAARHQVYTAVVTAQRWPGPNRVQQDSWITVGVLRLAAGSNRTVPDAMRSDRGGEQVWGATIRFPVWPSKMAVSLGILLITMQFLLDAIHGLLIAEPDQTQAERREHA
jgi:TRAP-type mannitol/chloroaromatic compound transport system permease small subunit